MKLSIFIVIFSMYYAKMAAQFQFEQISVDTPLIVNKLGTAHVTYNNYKLIFFADLVPFYRLKTSIKTAVHTVKNITRLLNKPVYTTAAGQLEHQMDMIYSNEEMLNSFRTTRFILCETCGKVNHWLLGVMDADTAREYDKVINNIGNATLENRQLIRNQSEIFQATLKFNTNTFTRFEKKINEILETQNNRSDIIKQLELEMSENSVIQYTQLLISEYYRVYG